MYTHIEHEITLSKVDNLFDGSDAVVDPTRRCAILLAHHPPTLFSVGSNYYFLVRTQWVTLLPCLEGELHLRCATFSPK